MRTMIGKAGIFRCILLCWVALGCSAMVCSGQSRSDSTALAQARWNVVKERDGITIKRLSIRLFGSDQQINWVEFSPGRFQFGVIQDSTRQKTSSLGKRADAVAAINGGFFQTGTRRAIAMSYLRSGGSVPAYHAGWADGAVVADSGGNLCLLNWNAGLKNQENDTLKYYPDVLTCGPVLVWNGQVLFRMNGDETRHPRSCVGLKDDGTVVWMVVDGRQRHAAGMTFGELAWVGRQCGLMRMLNLDGGGSSTLWVRGMGIMNRPSDKVWFIHRERPVCNALIARPDGSEKSE